MQYERHGGGCCGYGHIYEMDNSTPAVLRAEIERHLRAARGVNRIVEVILSERQINPRTDWERNQIRREVTEAGGWPAVLAAEGFRLAAEWRNSNSGNNCYQFIRIPELLTDSPDYNRSFRWEAEIVPAVAVAPIPAPVVEGIPERYRGEHPQPPANRVDPELPMLLWDNRTNQYFPVVRFRVTDERRIHASGRGYGCTLTGDIWYYMDTGRLGGSPTRGQLINYVPDAPAAPVQAVPVQAAPPPAPAPRFNEYYADLRGSGRHGPFETIEAARARYPRCRRFVRRTIMSDGNSLWFDVAREGDG